MKIRIGNDICLNVTLLYQGESAQYEGEHANINSLQAFIINASKEAEYEENIKNKTRFISRFPVEPYVDAYSSTAYDVKSSGYPTWRAYPKNHIYATYSGFGPHPDWDNMYRPVPERNLTQYKARVQFTDDPGMVKVFFPAEAQLYTGTYNLVIVAKVYDPGYSKDNLRTVTMDYEQIFTLVNTTSEDGVDSAVTLDVASTSRAGAVESVNINGDILVGISGVGTLSAKVSPVSVKDTSVSWSVADKDALYLAIVNKQPNACKYVALGLPDGQDSRVVTVYATSNQTPGVHGEIQVTINRNQLGDTYVDSGLYVGNPSNGGNVSLNLTNGQQVDIDLSKVAGWYEGD